MANIPEDKNNIQQQWQPSTAVPMQMQQQQSTPTTGYAGIGQSQPIPTAQTAQGNPYGAAATNRAIPTDRFGQGVQRQMAQEEVPIVGVGFDDTSSPQQAAGGAVPNVTESRVQEFNRELNKYRAGKRSIEQRVIDSERWWTMRNSFMAAKETDGEADGNGHRAAARGFQAKTSWLHNVITSKHADALEAYPSPNILPREEGDKAVAWMLSKIVPVVLRQNDFEATYDHAMWQKLKTGTAVYKVIWDSSKLNGLGDIAIERVDLLNVFWEPGINNIQDSKYVFHTEVVDKETLQQQYPQLAGKPLAMTFIPADFPSEDSRDKTDKTVVVDCYYKKIQQQDGASRTVLHYCKYVGNTVIYASEDDQSKPEGFYEHGKYPFVFDCLFPIEGSPAGYGYVDIASNPQIRIDMLNTAVLKNAMAGAAPRYFTRTDGAINEEEFTDLNNMLIHTNGNLGQDSLRLVDYVPMQTNFINFINGTIDELRETSSNTETSTGSSTNGVTAASALAALQEAAGKTSRASTKTSYRAYSDIVYMVIELIRQFYDMPRQFRITGDMGVQKFVSFTNSGMQPQAQGMIGGVDMGYRTPVYDIDVVPEKQNSYTRMAQNELALQFFQLGFFNPNLTDQALMCLSMMDFDNKDELMQQVQNNGTMYQQLQLYKAMAATLADKYEPALVGGLLNGSSDPGAQMACGSSEPISLDNGTGEISQVTKARERANTVNQPGGSTK